MSIQTTSLPENTRKLMGIWDRALQGKAGFYELQDFITQELSLAREQWVTELREKIEWNVGQTIHVNFDGTKHRAYNADQIDALLTESEEQKRR